MRKSLVKIIKIPKVADDCLLCFAQNPEIIDFPIRRIYFISQAKLGLPRGFHAHYKTEQIMFCLQRSIKIILDDGRTREEVTLDNPQEGLLLDKIVWHEMHNFQKETILLVVASKKYDASDYIRNYQTFYNLVNGKKSKANKI